MTNRARLCALMDGRQPDRVPWYGDLDYWYSAAKRAGSLPEQYRGDGYFQLNRDLGVGFYLQGYMPVHETSEGVTYTREEKEGRVTTTMHTPKGDLTQVQQFLPTSSSYGFVKHFVEEEKDLPAFRHYIENLRYTPNYGEALKRRDIVGDNGVVLCYTPRSPFMQMITTFSGVENLVYMLADCQDEINSLLRTMEARYDIAARLAVDAPAEFIMIPENLSSEVVGLRYYLEYLRPYERKWIGAVKEAGKRSLIHMDGTLRGLIKRVAETGFDIIEAATPVPSGDMTMREIADTVQGEAIIWGGLPGAVFTPKITDAQFEAHVIDTLSVMKEAPRYVLGVADQVPPDGLLSRVEAVAALCDQYGVY